MKIIKKFSPNEKDLKESVVQTKLMKDFPPIYKERNLEVLAELIAGYVKESGGIILDDETPDVPDETPLRVRGKRAKSDDGSEAAGVQTKKSKKDKSESSNPDNIPASAPKRKRGKGESSTTEDVEAEEERTKKKQSFDEKYESPMFIMTPEMIKHADEKAKKMIADKRQQKIDYLATRDAKLKSLGLENCDEYLVQKIAEVKQIAGSVEQETVEKAKEILEQIPETSEADALEAAPESATMAEESEASAKKFQSSDLPTTSPTPLPTSNDSDHDVIPLGQRMKILCKPSPQPQQTTKQLPLQAEQSSAAAEGSEDPEEPNTTDLPQCDSPSNLFSLERHLGGEITKTPQKATKSVPKKIDLVNQQQPQPIHQTTTEPSSALNQTQTQSPTNTHTIPLQMILPEPIAETVVPESVQVTESEPSVTVTVFEPIQKPTQTIPSITTKDQPSSSFSPSIQTLKQTPLNLLKSEFLEAEMQQISNDLQRLVQLRRSHTLKVAYEDQWATLKARVSDLMNTVSQKCIKIQAAAYLHHFSTVHSVEEDPAPLLYLADAPYFPESDYMSREAKMFKLLKQKVLKQQEDAKAREDLLL